MIVTRSANLKFLHSSVQHRLTEQHRIRAVPDHGKVSVSINVLLKTVVIVACGTTVELGCLIASHLGCRNFEQCGRRDRQTTQIVAGAQPSLTNMCGRADGVLERRLLIPPNTKCHYSTSDCFSTIASSRRDCSSSILLAAYWLGCVTLSPPPIPSPFFTPRLACVISKTRVQAT